MKIGIMGDTHGNLTALGKVVELAGQVNAWIHTGDYSQDAKTLETITGLPVYAVCGNCDMYEGRGPVESIVNLAGHKIWITHGNRYLHGYNPGIFAELADEKQADIVVFGHTHVPMAQWYGTKLVINPGSPARPRMGIGTYAILTLKDNLKPTAEICQIKETNLLK